MVVFKKGYIEIPKVSLVDKDLNENSLLLLNNILERYSVAFYMTDVLEDQTHIDENDNVFIFFQDYILYHVFGGDLNIAECKDELYSLHKKGYIDISFEVESGFFERIIYIPWWNEDDWNNSLQAGFLNITPLLGENKHY